MRNRCIIMIMLALMLLALPMMSCNTNGPDRSHTAVYHGVAHFEGSRDECAGAACHGYNRTGGQGPACSRCHHR